MSGTETRESIKSRLHQEAARQWGVDEIDLKNGSFDPLVDLLFGAFATETEKIWQEIESSRSHTIKRMVQTVLPETVTGIVPAHAVLMVKPAAGEAIAAPTDQFATSGNTPGTLTPAGTFRLSGASVRIIASGNRIDKVSAAMQRETVFRMPQGKQLSPQTCWLGIAIPANAPLEQLTLFFNWNNPLDLARYLPFVSFIQFAAITAGAFNPKTRFYDKGDGITSLQKTAEQAERQISFEQSARDAYAAHFVTLTGLSDPTGFARYPEEWSREIPESNAKTIFPAPLFWIKLQCPASLTAEALDRMEVTADCIPVLNRRLVHQRGRLQPLFNVYGLKDDAGFLGIQKVLNGDGELLQPVDQDKTGTGRNVYVLRNRDIATFDKRDAFKLLNDLSAKMRDDLAAFNAMDNSVISSNLEKITNGVTKLKEHLDGFNYALPQIYLLVKTQSAGTILDIYFWTSEGEKGNGLRPLTKLAAESGNSFKAEAALLMLPSTGGRNPMDESQMQNAFKEAILTRGRAVTVADYQTIAKAFLGDSALRVEVQKKFGIGQGRNEGLRPALEITIFPLPTADLVEDYWLRQARLVKQTLLQKSAGLMPLYISVEGFNWKL